MLRNRLRLSFALGALAAAFTMIAADVADARGRISFGSRGSRTHAAPPATTTAPTTRPIERSVTQPANPAVNTPARQAPQAVPPASTHGRPAPQVAPVIVVPGRPAQQPASAASAQPASAASAANPPGFTGGLLGAGLFGLVLGAGLTGGLGSLASFLGLALQIGIIAAIGWALLGLLSGRNQSASEIPVRDLQRSRVRSTFGLRNAEPR